MKAFAIILFLVGIGVLAYFLAESREAGDAAPAAATGPSTVGVQESSLQGSGARASRMIVANFSYPRYDGNEIRWEVTGVNADVKGEDEVKLEAPRITFYPKRNADARGPETVFFSSRRGDVKKTSNVALLYGDVSVTTSDGSELKTPALSSNFEEKRIHSDEDVAITRAGMRINGRGFDGHIEFEEFQIQEQITVSLESAEKLLLEQDPKTEPRAAARKPGLSFFTLAITCDGPMTMESLAGTPGAPKRWRVVFRQHVFICRETLYGESRLTADEVEAILLESPSAPGQEQAGGVIIDRLLAVGNAHLDDVQFSASARRILFQAVENQEVVTFSGPEQSISFKSARVFNLFEPGAQSGAGESRGEPPSNDPAAARFSPAEPTVVTCTGDAVVKRSLPMPDKAEAENVVATFDRSVRARGERADLLCDSLVVELKPSPEGSSASDTGVPPVKNHGQDAHATRTSKNSPDAGAKRFEISLMRACRNVLLVEDKLTAKADELVWTPAVGTADLFSHTVSELIDQKNHVLAKRIRMHRNENLVTCHQEVDATFLVEKGKGIEALFRTGGDTSTPPDPAVHGGTTTQADTPESGQPRLRGVEQEWRLKCETLQVKLRPEDNSFESLDAAGGVSISTERMEAKGASFVYYHSTGYGCLQGAPLATVTNADNVVTADEMEFSSTEKKIILRGRKHISLAYEQRDQDGFPTGKIERIEARSLGDIIIFQDEGVFYFLKEAVVTRPSSWMRSDRMTIYFDPKKNNRLQHIFAVGNVLINDAEGMAKGDQLEWDFDAGMLVVKAQPYACIAQQGKPLYGEIVTIDQDWTRIRSRNPKWGRGRIIIPGEPKEKGGGGKK